MKLRFSLRGLLLMTACLAVFLYWRDRPRQIANRFVAAIEAGDYALANSLFVAGYDDTKKLVEGDSDAEFWAERLQQSGFDWLRGECRATFVGKGTAFGVDGVAVATAGGIERLELSNGQVSGARLGIWTELPNRGLWNE